MFSHRNLVLDFVCTSTQPQNWHLRNWKIKNVRHESRNSTNIARDALGVFFVIWYCSINRSVLFMEFLCHVHRILITSSDLKLRPSSSPQRKSLWPALTFFHAWFMLFRSKSTEKTRENKHKTVTHDEECAINGSLNIATRSININISFKTTPQKYFSACRNSIFAVNLRETIRQSMDKVNQ